MKNPDEATPLKGCYVAVASLLCTLAMAADVFQGFRQRKLWFPCRFFTINAASITLIGIAMKLLVDVITELPGENDQIAKSVGILFLFTMLANFLPSLGGMDDKQLLTNIIALGILIITVLQRLCFLVEAAGDFQAVVKMSVLIFFLPWPFWVALTVPASRRILQHQYHELHQKLHRSVPDHQSSEELTSLVKKYWMMAETGNPQFVLACSPFCYASGLLCTMFAAISLCFLIGIFVVDTTPFWYGDSDYKWSISLILTMQLIGIVVGSIAPAFRCITIISYFNLSKEWSISHINMFRVEKRWTQRLRHWKRIHVTSYIPGRQCKKVFNHVKNMILNICMALQITLVVICKTICLVPTCIMLIFYSCCHFCNSLLKRLKKKPKASGKDVRSEIEEYIGYVLQIEEEKLSDRTLRNMLRSITKLLDKSEKKQPINLMKFLEKSKRFSGVVEFDNDRVPSSNQKEPHKYCWSLVGVTLTTIALALPNIENGYVKGLVDSMKEGLTFVRHIEETLNANGDLIKARKTATRIWTEAEVYNSWLEVDLQKKDCNGESSKEILEWLGEEAEKIMDKRSKKRTVYDSSHKFIAASSMKRISQTIQDHCNEQENWPTDVELFDWISTIIADILWACFTNLSRVITLKCHHDAIEKREENIRTAAQLLGKSKTILNILEERQLPDLDQESMAYIDKWHALPKSRIPNGRASSTGIQSASSSFNESVIVPIM